MTGRRTIRGVGAASALIFAVFLSGCAENFAGPYPCNEGFASCTTSDQCETSTASDPEHCGACGNACDRGATCTAGTCDDPPSTLASGVNTSTIGLNSSNVYWSTQSSEISGLPKSGGAEFAISLQNQQFQNNSPFAVDDDSLYYIGSNGPTNVIAAVPSSPSVTPVMRLVGLFASQSPSGQEQFVLSGDSLFFSQSSNVSGNNPRDILSVPKAGGTMSPVTTFFNLNQGFIVDETNVYAATFNNPCTIDSAPVSGGDAKPLVSTQNHGCPSALASDGTNLFWAAAHSEGSNNQDDERRLQRCVVEVLSLPVDGGASTMRAAIVVDEEPLRMAVDDSDVYLATNKSIWRVPRAGGVAARVAGNLGVTSNNAGPNGNGCTFGGGFGGSSYPLALAIDGTSIYLAVQSSGSQTGVLLRIAK